MRTPMPLVAAVVAAVSIPCVAAAQQQAQTPRAEARVERAAYVCATDEATRRSFEREYGVEPVFVTAEEALAAADAGERWTTPRCMTEAQHARLESLRRQTASKS